MKNTIWSFALILITFLSLGERCAAQYTVNWHVLNQVTSVQVEDGKSLTIPENINTAYCDDSKVFVGWTNNPITEETDVVPNTLFSEPTGKVKANADYYAVFAKISANRIPIATANWTKENSHSGWEQSNANTANYKNDYGALLTGHMCHIFSPDLAKEQDFYVIDVEFKVGKCGSNDAHLRGYIYDKSNQFIEYKDFIPTEDYTNQQTTNHWCFISPKAIKSLYIYNYESQADIVISYCLIYGRNINDFSTMCTSLQDKTINGQWNVERNTTVNLLQINDEGIVTIAPNCTLTVNTLSIATNFANKTSAQLDIKGEVEVENAYIDITLGKNADPNQWHAFTVPFPVDVINGIYDTNNNKLTNEVHYAIMDYHGDIRANGQYAWKKYRGVLVPGTFYLMTVDGKRQTFRFKKLKDAALVAENLKKLTAYSGNGNENLDKGWNGVGNPTLMYGTVNHNVLVLNPESYSYKVYQPKETQFTVGTPFFIQVAGDGKMSMLSEVPASIAPIRNSSTLVQNIKLLLANDNYTDCLYISASESATNDYEIGKDLLKMSMTTAPSVPQISAKAYGTQLCMIDVPAINDEIAVELNLYAPIEGEYRISIHENEDIELYLLHHGKIVHRLSSHETTIGLQQGNNAGYSILVRKPTTTNTQSIHTSHDNIDKIMYDNQLIIIHNGNSYDIMGRKR